MLEISILAVFIPTFLFVSATPGMCMTLSMTMGMTIGVRRTMWMMLGELVGVGLVATLAVIGAAAMMLNYPSVFTVFKYIGGAYLFYLGYQMWCSRGKMAIPSDIESQPLVKRSALVSQGFITAIANPKGWAFFISLLPPFINPDKEMPTQLLLLISLILLIEFFCLLGYASGGQTLRRFLMKSGNVRLMNRIAGTLMMGVGVWLAFG
ncbi:LysE family translocator [Neptunomonas phycophila]|uniref:LysE family translocator n=1 Tax=Neptunomonas phycophila TaxID=1572645 RepID=UPI000948CC7F|nr:LysE family translocator [Neptunomonas phycophila]QLE97721.1 LysE family translocator [Neptunomonas phycophila]